MGGFLLVLVLIGWSLKQRYLGALPLAFGVAPDARAELATWPWHGATQASLGTGMRHWQASQSDGTAVELLEFDFKANPRLRLEIFDQDSEDEKPWDNETRYSAMGVGGAAHLLNAGWAPFKRVVAAWNGVFFGYYDGASNPNGRAFHVAPVVIDGEVHSWDKNHRWTFGVQYSKDKPVFKVMFLPDKGTLQREFDYAGGSVQCLLKDGQALKLQPFPQPGDAPLPQPVPSSASEVGHIPVFDHMRTSRVSIGWATNSEKLYVLFVREPDNESMSMWALQHGWPLMGGWTVADAQQFWLAAQHQLGVQNAVNSDAGNVMQYLYRRPDGNYELVPPRGAGVMYDREVFTPELDDTPGGGSLTYFYVRESLNIR